MDLTNSNQYIAALSLVAIGNLATQDMARDLAPDIDKVRTDTRPEEPEPCISSDLSCYHHPRASRYAPRAPHFATNSS